MPLDHNASQVEQPDEDWLKNVAENGAQELQQLQRQHEMRRKERKAKKGGSKKEDTPPGTIVKNIIDSGIVELFQSQDSERWAAIRIGEARITMQINSGQFRRWLEKAYSDAMETLPVKTAIDAGIRYAEALAGREDAPRRQVCVRIGEHNGKKYLDLANDQWEAVEIDENGWRIVTAPPVYFRRTAQTFPLPRPVEGGDIFELEEFLNCDRKGLTLAIAFALGTLNPAAEQDYPTFVLTGHQDSAKTSFLRILKKMTDPAEEEAGSVPDSERNLAAHARELHVCGFDNVSNLSGTMSDALCKLATGFLSSHRELYTNSSLAAFAVRRPTILNGITDFATRADFLDRAIVVRLQPIDPMNRKDKRRFMREFQEAHPRLLGALLSLAARGMRRQEQISTTGLQADGRPAPRLADFALWVCACADGESEGASDEDARDGAIWSKYNFLDIYNENREEAKALAAEDDPLTDLLLKLLRDEGSPVSMGKEEMHARLVQLAGEERKMQRFLDSKKALGNAIRRAVPALHAIGIDVSEQRTSKFGRQTVIKITKPEIWHHIRRC